MKNTSSLQHMIYKNKAKHYCFSLTSDGNMTSLSQFSMWHKIRQDINVAEQVMENTSLLLHFKTQQMIYKSMTMKR